MESFPSPERAPVHRDEVIAILREKGREDPAAMELLVRWVTQNEEEANRINTSRATLLCAVKNARLYAEAGYKEIAIEELEGTREAAVFEQDEELLREIDTTIEDIRNS